MHGIRHDTQYGNADSTSENADGYAVKLHSGAGNYFENCVAAHLDPLNHYLEGCSAKGNYAAGFDRNNQSGVVTMKNCTGNSNKTLNFNWPLTGKPSALGYQVTFGKAKIQGCTSKNGKNNIKGAELSGNCVGF